MDPLSILQDRENQLIIYEDAVCFAILEKKPAIEGHVKLYSKRAIRYIEDIPSEEAEHIFFVMNSIATAVFEGVGAQGTNIVFNNGHNGDYIEINIIPRFPDDDLDLMWEPKQGDPKELDDIQKSLKQHTDYISMDADDKKRNRHLEVREESDFKDDDPVADEDAQDSEDDEEEDNYLIRQLNRLA